MYISGTAIAAIFETKPELGTIVSVLACRARIGSQPLHLAPVAMLQLRSTPRLGPLNDLNRKGALGHPQFAEMLRDDGLVDQWIIQD